MATQTKDTLIASIAKLRVNNTTTIDASAPLKRPTYIGPLIFRKFKLIFGHQSRKKIKERLYHFSKKYRDSSKKINGSRAAAPTP